MFEYIESTNNISHIDCANYYNIQISFFLNKHFLPISSFTLSRWLFKNISGCISFAVVSLILSVILSTSNPSIDFYMKLQIGKKCDKNGYLKFELVHCWFFITDQSQLPLMEIFCQDSNAENSLLGNRHKNATNSHIKSVNRYTYYPHRHFNFL